MCGFAGYIDTRKKLKGNLRLVKKMTDKIVHRGPDAFGYFLEENIAMGFRRLSIIDLKTGNQPMYSEDGSCVLICNGEIFNYKELKEDLQKKGYRFKTQSDVEVLLYLYKAEGVDLLNRINGQFAFVLYDKNRKRLFMARDQFGIVPLFYTMIDGIFIFASEIKSILEHPSVPRKVNIEGLDQVISFPGLVSPTTMFKDIMSLKCGHYLLLENDQLNLREYWDLDYPKVNESTLNFSEKDYLERLEELLDQSVKYRLQADVPVGLYLSGGLDSSLIAATIRKVSPDIQRHSFSVSFKNEEIDESKFQRLVSEQIESSHHNITFDWKQIHERLVKVINHTECPLKESYDTCALALSEIAQKNGIKVALTGQGADELFGGYLGYRFDLFRARMAAKNGSENSIENKTRQTLWGDKNLFYEYSFDALRKTRSNLLSKRILDEFPDLTYLSIGLINHDRIKDRHPVHKRSYLDFKLRLADHLLSDHGDRMNLANSVEGRFPFLDIHLIEFVKTIPTDLKVNRFKEKYILKKFAETRIPKEIVEREKFAFRGPNSANLLQNNVDWILDLLSTERIKRQGYFNPEMVESLKFRYSQPGFCLNPHFEIDLLMIVITFSIMLDIFNLPNAN